MCGLTGGWTLRDYPALAAAVPRMSRALAHRGPDSDGHWFDPEAGIALGHRRLAIVDLSPQGHQPMASPGGRYVLAFNGEIYNHLTLRHELRHAGAAPAWRGHSDTETLLAAIERWGVLDTLDRCIGMFAIALWDRQERELWLVRDRLGEKPLYYGLQRGNLLFASELKGLAAGPGFQGVIDPDAVALFMRHGSIAAPYSIYRGIAKLPPGTWLRIRSADLHAGVLPEPVAYWSAADAQAAGRESPFRGSPEAATDALESLLGDAVAQQMIADVPLGAFLSGGVDSSTIVALMQQRSSRPVRTFTIGFHEPDYNEAEHANAVARHLGTEHTELYISSAEAMAVIPRLPTMYDEPFSDSSQIPTFLVSEMARRHVTVSLSGDAGDELFLGYHRYHAAAMLRRNIERVPASGRRALAALARRTPASMLRLAMFGAKRFLADSRFDEITRERVQRFADVLESPASDGNYGRMMTHWPESEQVVRGSRRSSTVYDAADWSCAHEDFPELLGRLDLQGYLPDDILTKVDRAAMAVSLETRIPMLDHRVVEFAQRIPLSMKWRDGQSKWLLRQVLYRHVPAELIDRPKRGFGVPIDAWLRGPLRDWAENLLSPTALEQQGFFDPEPIARRWREHLSGQRDWQNQLWDVLMFQSWMESNDAVAVPVVVPEPERAEIRPSVGWR
jgi:asparagine synthase (glutamine-hydrolysing)